MNRFVFMAGAVSAAIGLLAPAAWAQPKPIRIGVPTAVQLQVGRDTQDALNCGSPRASSSRCWGPTAPARARC